MSTEINTVSLSPAKHNELFRSWCVFVATLLATALAIFVPIVFVAALILAILAAIGIKKATASVPRFLLIAAVVVAGLGLLLMGAATLSLAMA